MDELLVLFNIRCGTSHKAWDNITRDELVEFVKDDMRLIRDSIQYMHRGASP
uniref:Uncharacterized protein n=1 Tax=viral metagenome TaxID=1070528 RepID=A0A6M3IHN2_9ZZZZ